MISLAVRSLRYRSTAFTATFVSVLLATALIGSFAGLLETSRGTMATGDRDTLVIMGLVVGSWGTAIALFSLASTMGITVRQREAEIATLRTIGSTPRRARRMIRTETLFVSVAGSALGAVMAWFGGRVLLSMIRNGGLVAETVRYDAGVTAAGGTALVVVLTSLVSATIAARRSTSGPARMALTSAATDAARMPWWRVSGALLLIAYGVAMAVITVTVTADSDDPMAAMATSGSSCILVGVGLALLAPILLKWSATVAGPLVALFGAPGHLAARNTTRRAHLLAGVLAPVTVFTAASVGVLMLISVDGRSTYADVPEGDTITLLNNVVVAMISVFAAIMVINAFAAVTSHRRAELARLQLLGATVRQVRRSVVAEAVIVAIVGIVLGLVAACATVVPFSIARDEGAVPDGTLWLIPALAAVAFVLTVVAARSAVRRATSQPALMSARAA